MSDETSLSNKRILVLEDDYFLASDTRRTLQDAGAQVIGPFPSTKDAVEKIRSDGVDAAIIDINLGQGPSFDAAAALLETKTPFVFVTGYDQSVIPGRFGDVPRFEKPAQLTQVVEALRDLLAAKP